MIVSKSRADAFVVKGDLSLKRHGFQIIPEETLKRIGRHFLSRPDGVYVKGDLVYQEELKRPAEFDCNSWLSTYTNDPIAGARKKIRKEYDEQRMSREEAENRIIIAEADDHFAKRTITWDYPDELDLGGKTEKLVIRYSDDPQRAKHIQSLIDVLSSENRRPEVIFREAGQIVISFDPH